MANQLANQQTIDLSGELSTNLNKNKIVPFQGFNVRKNPLLNGCLKTFSEEDKTAQVIDTDGNTYTFKNGTFQKNGETIASSLSNTSVTYEELKDVSKSSYAKSYYLGNGNWLNAKITGTDYQTAFYFNDTELFSANAYRYTIQTNGDFAYVLIAGKGSGKGLIYAFNRNTYATNPTLLSTEITISAYSSLQINDINIKSTFLEDDAYLLITGMIVQDYSITNCRIFGMIINVSTTKKEYEFDKVYSDAKSDCYMLTDANNLEYVKITTDSNSNTIVEIGTKFTFTLSSETWSLTTTAITASAGLDPFSPIAYSLLKNVTTVKKVQKGNFFYAVGITSDNEVIQRDSRHEWSKSIWMCGGAISGGTTDEDDDTVSAITVNARVNAGEGWSSGTCAFNLLINNGEISAVSMSIGPAAMGTVLIPWLTVDDSYFEPYIIDQSLIVYTKDGKIIKIKENRSQGIKLVNDTFILFDSISPQNCYNIKTGTWHHFASDWNNRFYINTSASVTLSDTTELASGNVDYINKKNIVPSAIFNPVLICSRPKNYYGLQEEITFENYASYTNIPIVDDAIDIYKIQSKGNPVYTQTINANTDYDFRLAGTEYPVETDGNAFLNPALNTVFFNTKFLMNYIKAGEDYYFLTYLNGNPLLLYGYATQLGDVDTMFVIQGQSYIIRNNTICSATVSGNSLQDISTIISCGNMIFLGSSVSAAYFFSNADKYIYVFTGDRKLARLVEMSELTTVRESEYDTNTNSFFIISNDGCYIIMNEEFFFKIDGDFDSISFTTSGFALRITGSTTWKNYTYYGDGNVPVEFETSFYGLGDNRLSIIDCWYIRLYCASPKDGEIECSIIAMTDEVKESNKQIFHVKKSDWDSITQTYLIRYQPHYQKSIGTSLKVKSDFDVQDLQCSYIQDTAVQLSKITTNRISGSGAII